jgi:hypothetical protein
VNFDSETVMADATIDQASPANHPQGVKRLTDIAMGRTDNLNIRIAAAFAPLFKTAKMVVAMLAIL